MVILFLLHPNHECFRKKVSLEVFLSDCEFGISHSVADSHNNCAVMATQSIIFLIGYRCTGKTVVAQLLAQKLGWDWIDADCTLEARYGRSIRQIFADDGEAGFRDKEEQILAEL